jgi:hypothetical protein
LDLPPGFTRTDFSGNPTCRRNFQCELKNSEYSTDYTCVICGQCKPQVSYRSPRYLGLNCLLARPVPYMALTESPIWDSDSMLFDELGAIDSPAPAQNFSCIWRASYRVEIGIGKVQGIYKSQM